ncbi:pirin family protein [Sungkyunkwania multivorans]|uniref:Pirin family protein n=1 Tax=Sungkyunkwania multivorans TaxID=1173618 RepID=A0ABW3CUD3_9FLAO
MTAIKKIIQLGNQWQTQDPFLFCAYHHDHFPAGNEDLGPKDSITGRNIGMDFANKDGWNMYHGTTVPGFPHHPHRGFETVTIVEKGVADHFDSLGAHGRFGKGDVQWMTAGKGVQHSEMFPLLNSEEANELLLFQIWLNLPAKDKKVPAHYKMLWNEDIPIVEEDGISIKVIAGTYVNVSGPAPTPNSWAADTKNDVNIWLIKLAPKTTFTLPKNTSNVNRSLYFYEGGHVYAEGYEIPKMHGLHLHAAEEFSMENGEHESHLMLLQGRPIGEAVVQQGPFVANSQQEMNEAIAEYRATEFGGWPWDRHDPIHPKEKGRFAIYEDGSEDIRV